MSNIDLNSIFNKQKIITSPVDSSIELNQNRRESNLYSDLKLDLSNENYKSESLNSNKSNKDLELLVDEECILNSLRNIMMTTYCSRLLNPDMNFDLRSYLFEELTEAKAYFIAYDILTTLPFYEPRIEITNINTVVYYNADAYGINLNIFIPSINKNVKLSSILDSQGLTFST